ncbi:hypothetical protein SAMD00019534_105090 [Acytostelium subglobosum LB1]|uniref:hypothetical protein n=1 Tax=Acytostelium subglobosum LB1 TaxID=1410327 RepID=UPI000644E21F|nr:hypothetical protein SAMD00019534_105090 [Acytostelium subglobosum LB1]GAM27334.1 hypothetical protein SAMD00019534_105090 [Acytostelium subglobosum LB1]|eukprot:XP_012749801.1 hypothetical protein SAMD00019534_105090 [Acytostelium subglobosum LB1]
MDQTKYQHQNINDDDDELDSRLVSGAILEPDTAVASGGYEDDNESSPDSANTTTTATTPIDLEAATSTLEDGANDDDDDDFDDFRLPSNPLLRTFFRVRNSKVSVLVSISVALFCDMVCYGLVLPILPGVMEEKYHQSESVTGVLFAMFSAGSIISTPVFGSLSDKIGRKTPFLIGLISLIASTLMFAYGESLWILFVARFAQGVSSAVSWVVGLALIADIYPPERLGTVIGSVVGGNAIGAPVGPLIGGILYEHFGYRVPFLVACGITAFDLFIRLVFVSDDAIKRHKQRKEAHVEKSLKAQDKDGAKAAAKEAARGQSFFKMAFNFKVIVLCLTIIIQYACFAALEPTIPLYLKRTYNSSSTVISLMFATMTLPAVFIAPLSGKLADKVLGHFRTVLLGMVTVIFVYPFITFASHLWETFVIVFILSAGLIMTNTPLMAVLTLTIDPHQYNEHNGKIASLFNCCFCIGFFVGPILGSAIMDHVSFRWSNIVFTILLAILSLLFFITFIKIILTSKFGPPQTSSSSEPPSNTTSDHKSGDQDILLDNIVEHE